VPGVKEWKRDSAIKARHRGREWVDGEMSEKELTIGLI